MVTLGVLVIIAMLSAMIGAWLLPDLQVVGLIAATALVAVTAWAVWWSLLYFQVVRIDPILQRLHIYRLDTGAALLLFLGPPAATAAAFAVFVWRWRCSR